MTLEITAALALAWAAAAALLLTFLFSSAFLRGRTALAAAVLLWAWFGFALATGAPSLDLPGTPRLEAVLLFAPLDLLLLACMAETIVFSRAGAIIALLLVVQSVLAYWLPAPWWDALWALERMPARGLGQAFASRGLPPPGTSAFIGLLTAAIAAYRSWRDADVVLVGIIVAALASAWLGYGLLLGLAPWVPLLLTGAILLGTAGWASYRMAFLDALTGLPGRRVLDERMARLGRRWSVAMVDVDHFKKFNDTHGHDVGDQVLKMVASKLRRHFGSDAYRYGGEEFTVLFVGRGARDALRRCERFREDVAGHEMQLRAADRPQRAPATGRKKRGKQDGRQAVKKGSGRSSKARAVGKAVSVTVSIGVAARSTKRRRPEVVLKAADVALYKAKDTGRNRVVDHGA